MNIGREVAQVHGTARVDVIVSEWLGGLEIDERVLVPVIVARDRWLKPGGVMIPRLVMAWAALVHDRYLAEMVAFLRDNACHGTQAESPEPSLELAGSLGSDPGPAVAGCRHQSAGDSRPCPTVWA
jgi:hypothetical protein